MNISIAIASHPNRAKQAKALFEKLNKQGFYHISLNTQYDADISHKLQWDTMTYSWQSCFDSDWHIVIEDDAIISDNFYYNVRQALENVPDKNATVSFYTGKVKPFPYKVEDAVKEANKENASWIKFNRICWGVCIAMPTRRVANMNLYLNSRYMNTPYDQRISTYHQIKGLPVYYTNPSLVDHDYKLGSLYSHQDNKLKRVAWNYIADKVGLWNNVIVEM